MAKLEAWKQKQAAERERKQKELAASGGARSILDEIDKKSAQSTQTVPQAQPQAKTTPATSSSPSAGKFDPKAIAKKSTGLSTAPSLLGNDVSVPNIAKPNSNQLEAESTANKPTASTSIPSCKPRQKTVIRMSTNVY